MIAAKDAFKETKKFIENPDVYECIIYQNFLKNFKYLGIDRLLNRMIKEQIHAKKFELTINLKSGQDLMNEERDFFWQWEQADNLRSFEKLLTKLKYKSEFKSTLGQLKYITISWDLV
nr:hypothetical protein GTC16762_33860 [Pigmentibacter ruber]